MFVDRMKKGGVSCWGYYPTSRPTLGQKHTPPCKVLSVRGSESPGSKTSVVRSSREGAEPIDEIVESGRSPLDSIVRDGARRMLQAALESEVKALREEHAVLLDERGRRRVVRNSYHRAVYSANHPRVHCLVRLHFCLGGSNSNFLSGISSSVTGS